jgi:peptidoglycan/xylan/chitin deacetylase (PgdA/CDA1 family)
MWLHMNREKRSLVEDTKHAAGRYGGFCFGGQRPDGVTVHRPLPEGTVFPNGAAAALLLTFDVEGNYGNGIGDEDREVENYERICGRLGERDIRATFNVVGQMAEDRGEVLLKSMVEAGCEVASHGYVHDMNKRHGGDRVYAGHYGPDENRSQVLDGVRALNGVLSKVGGNSVRGMRFPYGHFNEYTYEAVESAGLAWTSNVGIDDFVVPGLGYGNAPFLMSLGDRVFDVVEIPLDSQTYDWSTWVADEGENPTFVQAVRSYCTLKGIPLQRTPRGAVSVWQRRMLDAVESGGIFTLLCHPINLTVRPERWGDHDRDHDYEHDRDLDHHGDPLEEFLFPVIDLLAGIRDRREAWVCTCGQLADFYRQVQKP